jgi:hypothetical protein
MKVSVVDATEALDPPTTTVQLSVESRLPPQSVQMLLDSLVWPRVRHRVDMSWPSSAEVQQEERLQLVRLHSDGVLTDEEYAAATARLHEIE